MLAFSYTQSVVPQKSYLMPESFHVLVEKFVQFKHICFFFPPCYIQRVKMVPVSIILNMVSGLPPFQSSATDEGKFLGSGFLMPPKLVAFQAPPCSFSQFGLYQGHLNPSDIFQYLWILKKKESGPISFPSISASFSRQLVDTNKFKQDWCSLTSPPAPSCCKS